MAVTSFVLWLHGLGDSGSETNQSFRNTSGLFFMHLLTRSAVMDSPKDQGSLLKAVQNVHAMINKYISSGIDPKNVFLCGFSQGGALTLASVLLYPKTSGGGAVFSGWVPFNNSILEQVTPDARKTPILWSHGMADRTVLFEAGQAGPPFLEKAGVAVNSRLTLILLTP